MMSDRCFTEGSIIVVESPIYSEIAYKKQGDDEDDLDLKSIVQETGGYLTVFSKSVRPINETALDKLQLNMSSSDSMAVLGNSDQVMHED